MNRKRILRPSRRISPPELRMEEQTGFVDAAGIGAVRVRRRLVLAAQRRVRGTGWRAGCLGSVGEGGGGGEGTQGQEPHGSSHGLVDAADEFGPRFVMARITD